ncbi:MAG: molybdopterin-dependent oxidoreductase [Gemmatimonadota bacterium]
MERSRVESRLPPGQVPTRKWPVLHFGSVPRIPRTEWKLELRGAVEVPTTLDWDALRSLPQRKLRCDIHCVTGWSRLGSLFTGVPMTEVAPLARPLPEAGFALVHAPGGWCSSFALEDLLRDDVLLAHSHGGRPISPEHGGPVRLVAPHLYFWKSAKWVQQIEILAEERPGFWERNGYHRRGDPWREERFAW